MKTKYIFWQAESGYEERELCEAAQIIIDGGLVAFPTETVYGLGGDGLSKEAARKIYEAKGRPSDNPLILHIAEKEDLAPLVRNVSPQAEKLMDAFWPGPLTLIFEKSELVPYETTGGLKTVAVRMPIHEGAREFIRKTGVPVAAPSANLSGRPSPTTAGHVKEDLDGRIDMIIDGGQVGIGIESTIVDLTEDEPVILRPGHITKEMIWEITGAVKTDPGLTTESNQKPKAPGMKYRHYAPKAELTIVEGSREKMVEKINQMAAEFAAGEVGILATEETKEKYPHGCVICMGSRKEETIARELYSALREFDHKGVAVIYSESFSGEPQGEAVMNRLKKAAGQKIIYLS